MPPWADAPPHFQAFLVRELNNLRPLLPAHKSFQKENPKVHEVLETFRMVAATGPDALGAYVISMAHQPSDVLAVELLQKEVGLRWCRRSHLRSV